MEPEVSLQYPKEHFIWRHPEPAQSSLYPSH